MTPTHEMQPRRITHASHATYRKHATRTNWRTRWT